MHDASEAGRMAGETRDEVDAGDSSQAVDGSQTDMVY